MLFNALRSFHFSIAEKEASTLKTIVELYQRLYSLKVYLVCNASQKVYRFTDFIVLVQFSVLIFKFKF